MPTYGPKIAHFRRGLRIPTYYMVPWVAESPRRKRVRDRFGLFGTDKQRVQQKDKPTDQC